MYRKIRDKMQISEINHYREILEQEENNSSKTWASFSVLNSP